MFMLSIAIAVAAGIVLAFATLVSWYSGALQRGAWKLFRGVALLMAIVAFIAVASYLGVHGIRALGAVLPPIKCDPAEPWTCNVAAKERADAVEDCLQHPQWRGCPVPASDLPPGAQPTAPAAWAPPARDFDPGTAGTDAPTGKP